MTTEAFSLKGKNAVVTGAGTGICRAIALAFAEAGAQVACIDLNEKAAEETAGLIRDRGQHGIAVSCDVSSEDGRDGSRHLGAGGISARSMCW